MVTAPAPYTRTIHAKAIDLIKLSLEMTAEAGSGHPTSAASLAHLVAVLLYDHMRIDPDSPEHPGADRLVLSEGHACPIVYAAAADLGIAVDWGGEGRREMNRSDVRTLRAIDSPIDGHPNPAEGFPFFPAATGSLGQGLSIAVGLALAARLDGLERKVFALIGDGESREGQIWEAVDLLVDEGLAAVCPIFNCNGYGQAGRVSVQQSPDRLMRKLEAAGLAAVVIDGHDAVQIRDALEEHARGAESEGPPLAIVARTLKAWGTPSFQGGEFHGKPLQDEDLSRAIRELEATRRVLTIVGGNAEDTDDSGPESTIIPGAPRRPSAGKSPVSARPESGPRERPLDFDEALREFGQAGTLENGKMATRRGHGMALRALGRADGRVVVLDGDVRNSTYSESFLEDPELRHRFVAGRIAEQNIMSCAAGLAAGGKIPFVSTFGKFLVRAYDQLEMAIISRLNVKIVGSHSGVSLAADGPSQMALADLGFFHALSTVRTRSGTPMLYVLQPSDARSAYELTLAMGRHVGACALRTHRPEVPILHDRTTSFVPGGHHVLADGEDLVIVASGYMVHEAMAALEELTRQGIAATLVDLYSMPFDEKALVELARERGGQILTVEDNYGGGFGSAIAQALAGQDEDVRVRSMHVRSIPKSGRSPDDVLEYLGLSRNDIVARALSLVRSPTANRVG